MAQRHGARSSAFDKIKKLVLREIKKHRSITLSHLQKILFFSFGTDYFQKRRNVNILTDVMEYLLYTKRLAIINRKEQRYCLHTAQMSTSLDNNNQNRNNQNNNGHRVMMCYSVITEELLFKYKNNFNLNSSNILAQNVCTAFDPLYTALSRRRIQDQSFLEHYFTNKINCSGRPIGNQKNSGRCWIFACLNVIRVPFMKKYNIKQFEFSQAHIFFWDKIERSNYFLNAIVSTAKNGHTLDSRTVMCLLKNPVEDGGYWTMAVNIIKKHGILPKVNFHESYSSEESQELNDILNSKLREFAIILHDMVTNKASDNQISAQIKNNMCIVYRIVGICLSIPKRTFKWYYQRVDGNNHQSFTYVKLTPLEFYKTVVRPTINLEDKVSLICDPRPKQKYGHLYTLDLIGNVTEGSKIVYNNQPIEVLLEACKQSIIKLDEPVWYSCEVNQRFSNELGIDDLKIHDIKSIFGTDISIPLSKSDRILYQDSSPTHAMVLTGVHIENDESIRWRVENSWGNNANTNGYIMMTTEWFKEYVFEVVVDKKLLPKYVLDVFNQKPVTLPLWDQLGAYSLVN